MQAKIIRKLNLKRANFCLEKPYQYLILYHYKKDIFMAESDLSDGIARQIVVYSTWTKEYSFPPGDYLLRVSQTEIDYGLNKNNKILNNDTKLIDSSIDQ